MRCKNVLWTMALAALLVLPMQGCEKEEGESSKKIASTESQKAASSEMAGSEKKAAPTDQKEEAPEKTEAAEHKETEQASAADSSDPVKPVVKVGIAETFQVDLNGELTYYKAEMPGPGYLKATCTQVPDGVTPAYRFVDASGEELQDSHESDAVRVEKGVYYTAFYEKWGNEVPSTVECRLDFQEEVDSFEPNNSPKSAKRVSLDEEISFAVYPRWDVDYFEVEVPGAGYLNVVMTGPAEDVTYNYRFLKKPEGGDMFDKGEAEELQDSHESNAVRVEQGTYIVGVSDKWSNMPQSLQKGKMKFVFVPEMDSYEPNNSVKSAAKVSLDEKVSFAIYPRWDVDYFEVEVPGAGYLNAVVTEATDDISYNFRFLKKPEGGDMFDKEGGEELQDSHESNAVRVEQGTYIVGVSDKWDNMPESFQKGVLEFKFVPEMDSYEPNNDAASAKEVPLGEEFVFAIYPRWDKDYFKVKVEEEGVLQVVVTEPAEGVSYNYFFGDASGSKLQSSTDKDSYQVGPGTYIIGLWDRWDNRPEGLQKTKAKIVLVKE